MKLNIKADIEQSQKTIMCTKATIKGCNNSFKKRKNTILLFKNTKFIASACDPQHRLPDIVYLLGSFVPLVD